MSKRNEFKAWTVAAVVLSLLSFVASTADAVEHGSVVIKRDDYGIPNIYSDNRR